MARLTKTKLKKLIVEVINEVRVAPDHRNFATDEQIVKIRSLLDSGNPESIEMAKSILDALGASPSYFDDYMRYLEVGEVEKLANKHGVDGVDIDLSNDASLDALEDYFTELDKFEKREVGRGRTHPDPAREFYDRYEKTTDMYKEKETIEEAKLNPTFWSEFEHRSGLSDRVLADPQVHPNIKSLLRKALDRAKSDPEEAEKDFNQVSEFLKTLYPKYAEELDRYDSHQGSLEYEQEFVDFYKDAKKTLPKKREE